MLRSRRDGNNRYAITLGESLLEGIESPYVLLAIGNGGARTYDSLKRLGVLRTGDVRVLLCDQADAEYYTPTGTGKGWARRITRVYDESHRSLWRSDAESVQIDDDMGKKLNPDGYPVFVSLESDIKSTGNGVLGGMVFGANNGEAMKITEVMTAAEIDNMGIAHFPGHREVPQERIIYNTLPEFLKEERRELYEDMKAVGFLDLVSRKELPKYYKTGAGGSKSAGVLGRLRNFIL